MKTPKSTAQARKEILEFLRANPRSTVVEIREGIDLNETAIRKNTVPMEKAGLLARERRSHMNLGDLWSLAEEGQ